MFSTLDYFKAHLQNCSRLANYKGTGFKTSPPTFSKNFAHDVADHLQCRVSTQFFKKSLSLTLARNELQGSHIFPKSKFKEFKGDSWRKFT